MFARPGKHLRDLIHPEWDRTKFLPIDEMIDLQCVAHELGVTSRSVQYWQSRGWMPYRQKRGKQLLYRRGDIANVKTALALMAKYYG